MSGNAASGREDDPERIVRDLAASDPVVRLEDADGTPAAWCGLCHGGQRDGVVRHAETCPHRLATLWVAEHDGSPAPSAAAVRSSDRPTRAPIVVEAAVAAPSPALEGRVALVTGASQGIGASIATALAAAGMRVWMVARNASNLERAAATAGPCARAFPADLTNPDDRDALLRCLVETEGGLDVLVNNAGIYRDGCTEDSTVDDFRDQLTANVLAPYALTQACLPMLRERRGEIVFVNSSAGKRANPSKGQFSATQHAMRAFADSLRGEVNEAGIRVLVVHPGRTATPRQELMHDAAAVPYHPERLMQPSDVAAVVVGALCMPRTAEITDVSLRPMLKS